VLATIFDYIMQIGACHPYLLPIAQGCIEYYNAHVSGNLESGNHG